MKLDKFKPVSKVIDGMTVEVAPLPVRQALKYKFKLLSLAGAPLINLIKGFLSSLMESKKEVKSFSIMDLDVDLISDTLFSSINAEEITDHLLLMCGGVRINNVEMSEEVLNAEFIGNLTGFYKVFLFVLEVNYKDFLGGATIDKPVVAERSTSTSGKR